MVRFLGRGTIAELPNSLIRLFKWQHAMDAKKEEIDICDLGKICLVQNLKSGGWKTRGRIIDVRRLLMDNYKQKLQKFLN